MESAKVIIQVVAGIIPEQPMPEHTRRFGITGKQWDDAEDPSVLLAETNGRAQGYAGFLMLQPDMLNWVRIDWIWV